MVIPPQLCTAAGGAVQCAVEEGACLVPAGTTVHYGANRSYVTKTANASAADMQAWRDKHISADSANATLASTLFGFLPPVLVSVPCTTVNFGSKDPQMNYLKRCWYTPVLAPLPLAHNNWWGSVGPLSVRYVFRNLLFFSITSPHNL